MHLLLLVALDAAFAVKREITGRVAVKKPVEVVGQAEYLVTFAFAIHNGISR